MTSDEFGSSAETLDTRRASLRSSSPKRHLFRSASEQETTQTPGLSNLVLHSPAPTTRKRGASDDSVEEIQGTESVYQSLSTPGLSTRSSSSASQICLCQPDPKVPRPRNAFILYRQHHQAAVVSSHPGLANPEISKIIGDHWRTSTAETKNHWRLLAEEEKLRHQRQYPDYRYQPRRSGRNSAANIAIAHGLETPRCIKCGGRSMVSPSSLLSPTTPMPGFTSMMPPSTPSSSGSAPGGFLRSIRNPSTPLMNGYQARPMTTTSVESSMRLAALRDPYPDTPMSPDAKRRRFTSASGPGVAENRQLTPLPFSRRRESLPRPDFMPRSQFSMTAPPKPNNHSNISHEREGSLTLPPLKTVTMSEASMQAKSVEAMIMSISVINKVKVLAKISRPLPPPGPTSPPQAIRGAIIAIDGTDPVAMKATLAHITEIFSRDPKIRLRVWESPKLDPAVAGEACFADYLQLINKWHAISDELKRFITSTPPVLSPIPESPNTTSSAPHSSSDPANADTPMADTDDHDSTTTAHKLPCLRFPASHAHPAPFPIALVPSFQLSLTDAAASSIPIADAYAPIDHWQWMATLWRGIVGPDLTIVVRSAHFENGSAVGITSPRDEGRGNGGVEVRLGDARAVVLRCESGGIGNGVSESALRRVGFEVGEWVRGVAGGGAIVGK